MWLVINQYDFYANVAHHGPAGGRRETPKTGDAFDDMSAFADTAKRRLNRLRMVGVVLT